jgi:opacity protein-like surface antigen
VGYRLRPRAVLVPYLAAGAGSTSYRETSVVGGVTDEQSQNKFSWHAALGADYGRGALGLGVEARYTSVPDALGLSGVSKVYGEKDLGGFAILARLSFRR